MDKIIIFSAIAGFIVSVIIGPVLIPYLRKLKFGQTIRQEGPKEHMKKSGTPVMGGLIFLFSLTIVSLFFIKEYPNIIPILLVTLGFGLIGFLDDFIKVVKKRNLGLRAWQKMLGQFLITVLFYLYIVYIKDFGFETILPFTNGTKIDMGFLFLPMFFIVILGTVNGSNFTDGLDGLEGSVTTIIAVFLTIASVVTKSGIEPITAILVGALSGFLIFNVYPAKVFMGDTGSLALGGFVAASAYMLQMPFLIVIFAFIYLIEVISVIIQVLYFKATKGKRFFKMAPIHHHFEMSGWSETRIVNLFTIVTVILSAIAYLAI